jgi:hypothetical protein
MAPNAAYKTAAGELQLEDIKKRINKDVLRQLNMSDDDFQNFLKAYQEMQNRKHPATADKEKLAVPQTGNRTLSNTNVRRVEPGERGKAGTVQRLGPTFAPPEFREAYKEFSKRISQLEQTKQKQ